MKTPVNLSTIFSMLYESANNNYLAKIAFGNLLVLFVAEVLYFPGSYLSAQLYSIQWHSMFETEKLKVRYLKGTKDRTICDAIRSG